MATDPEIVANVERARAFLHALERLLPESPVPSSTVSPGRQSPERRLAERERHWKRELASSERRCQHRIDELAEELERTREENARLRDRLAQRSAEIRPSVEIHTIDDEPDWDAAAEVIETDSDQLATASAAPRRRALPRLWR